MPLNHPEGRSEGRAADVPLGLLSHWNDASSAGIKDEFCSRCEVEGFLPGASLM